MKKQTKAIIAASILAAIKSTNAYAHLEPKHGDGMEKCYGVSKAHKNDCASKVEKHSCMGMAKTDNSPNDWVKLPKGLCKKITGGIIKTENETKSSEN